VERAARRVGKESETVTKPRAAALWATTVLGTLLGASGPSVRAQESGDDNYRFSSASSAVSVELAKTDAGSKFAWPKPASAAWDTALLGVNVDAGAEEGAWVELAAGSARVTQYLDPAARGLRWINLSGLRSQLTEGAEVAIAAHGLSLEAGPATLRVFANRLDLTRRILILAPHPDDAEIAAFGLYAGTKATTIVTVTSGNAGDANYADDFLDLAEQYLFKGFLRAVDSVTVPWQGGIPPDRCYNLGYFDARLAQMHEKPTEVFAELYGPNNDVAPYRRANVSRLLPNGSRTNRWTNLVSDLQQVFKKVKPAIVVMPYPQLDTHADHQFATVAAVEALARVKGPTTFLLYTNHAFRNLYPFGPAGTGMSLPPWPEKELPVEGVYSHAVSPELQRRKLYALETMHDLRLSPAEQGSCYTPGAGPKRPDYPRQPAVDYFRRGPRSDEVFFVYGRDGVDSLVRSFLADRKASARP
jgi:LmbE family N-acetylglucosaminyl deacetylase